MLIYLKDKIELKILMTSLLYFKFRLIERNSSQGLISDTEDLIKRLQKEIEYYDTSTQKD